MIWTLLILLALDNLGVNITALVAGLGVGGVAVALSLQNILGDLFASLSIALDKPFTVGDSLTIDTFVGRVEHIGIKTTRLRSESGEQIILSNADVLKSRVRNFGRQEEQRILVTIRATYDTPSEKLKELPKLLEKIVREQTVVRFERCHLRTLGESSFLFELSYFVQQPAVNSVLNIQQAVNFRIIDELRSWGWNSHTPRSRSCSDSPKPALNPMFHVVLFEPEIPPNTGNAIRLCANIGATLHLVKPLGFRLDDKSLQRSGLDYHDLAELKVHEDLHACLSDLKSSRLFAVETGGARCYTDVEYRAGDAFLFGPETRGLPAIGIELRRRRTIACPFPCARTAAASTYPMPSRSSVTRPGVRSDSRAVPAARIVCGSRSDSPRPSCGNDDAALLRCRARSDRRSVRLRVPYFLEQLACAIHARPGDPIRGAQSGRGPETAHEGAFAHGGEARQILDSPGLIQAACRFSRAARPAIPVWARRAQRFDGPLDKLRLTAVAMRRDHQSACHLICIAGPIVAAHQVQTQVQPCCTTAEERICPSST